MLDHVLIHEILKQKTVFYSATMLIMTRITAMMMFLLVMAEAMEKELSVLNMHREFIMQVRNRKESNYKELE